MTFYVGFSGPFLGSHEGVIADVTYAFVLFGASITFLIEWVLLGIDAWITLAKASCVFGL
ncbi:uncharacterized protein G6M90_00g008430 [Metarhizium brunneum]|uniref:Uncharacterized protein n=1 Tax=Metarhizium brunneum TaxID=500148 RepID=A0A7D5USS3_9HYPO|nr:hypothetical protein G6M90_00g008430 [Metarhizium brunneum]